jgi:hypothetical protein
MASSGSAPAASSSAAIFPQWAWIWAKNWINDQFAIAPAFAVFHKFQQGFSNQ